MIRLLFHIILLGVVAAFVAINVSYTTTINLFGYMFEDISTVAVVLISLIAGVLYSFIYYILSFFRSNGAKRAKKRAEKTKDKERELKEKEDLLKKNAGQGGGAETETATPAIEAPVDSTEEAAQEQNRKGGLFKRKKKR